MWCWLLMSSIVFCNTAWYFPRTSIHPERKSSPALVSEYIRRAGPDSDETRDIAELLATIRGSPGLKEAIDALVVRDPQAPWALAGGACSALANIAAEGLRVVAPDAAGLVHAVFVAEENYGIDHCRRYQVHGIELELAIAPYP